MIHKTTRSILSVLLAALLLVTSTPLTPAFADGGEAVPPQSESGEGRALEPAADGKYYISTAEQLEEFADKVNDDSGKYTDIDAELTDDIDLNSQRWTPIGSDSRQYSGNFDGNGHTISGLYIYNSTAGYQGLFGYVSGSGKIENLSVSGSVSGNNNVGGVVGLNRGTVKNCYNTGNISGNNSGGVVGYNGGTVENCYNTGNISGNISGGSPVGGVVGRNDGTVKNCYNTGKVSGNYVGGVVGLNNSGIVKNCHNIGEVSGNQGGGVVGDNGGTVENCYNTASVNCSIEAGGVVGYNISSVTNCYNTGKVSGSTWVGGVVGHNNGGISASASVTNCYNTGKVSGSGNSDVGGVVGYNEDDGIVANCYFLQQGELQGIGDGADATGATVVNDLNALCKALESNTTWTIHSVLGRPVLNENKEGGLGTEASPYEISTADELENFRNLVNNGIEKSAHAKLMNNIDLSSVCSAGKDSWTPIGSISKPYSGTFDGNGHKIENLYINTTDSGADNQGLFGYLGTSGDNKGTVQNLTVSGSVKGHSYVGGVVGVNHGTVTNCAFSGSVSGSYVGGVVGYNSGSVTNCYNTGTITGTDDYVGGVVGYNDGGRVENCHNIGEVSGSEYVGGVVGENSSGSVENCYNTGSGTGTGTDDYVGGVVGYNYSGGSVTNSYNTSSVKGDWYVGGVVGSNSFSATVTNCYNTGTVTGTGYFVGGVVGDNISSTVENCYYQQRDPAIFGIGGTTKDDTTTVAKTAAEFQSGEVAYLLQSKQTAGSSQVWGQSALGTEDSLPTLVALNPDAAKEVYQLTFDWHYEGAPEGTTTTTNVYTNGSVTLPADNEIPTRTGYHISGWKDNNGQPVTAGTTVEEDAVFTAEWTANTYTITVTAGSGGTVSGSGEYSEGTEVTVTATPATGYHFVNWTGNGTEVSTEATFTFNATVDRNLIAIFAKNEEPTPTPTPDPTPSGPSTGDSSGWDDIRDELENAENGDEITIDMGDETKVPAEIFESLAGKDVDVTFDLGDIQWSVNGADIPTDTDFTDLDLGASLDTHGIPVDVVNAITGEVGTVQITLAHNGEFGFTMTLTAPLGKENAGYWANLYHYDEDAEALNFEAAAKIDEDGSVTIPFSHASQYAIVIDTHSHATVDVSDLFIDIAPDAWYKDAVQYAYDNGLMTGVSATEFAPEQTTTRAMIVSILARLEGVTTAEAAGFADVDDEWYATAVNWAANVGVVNGYEDNTFQPNTAITREQLAAILMNYAAYKGEDVSARVDLSAYTDQPSAWAEETMSWAVAEGLISGVTADTLQPQGAATRAQVAAILQRFLSE